MRHSHTFTAAGLLAVVLLSAWWLADLPGDGRVLSFSVLSGAAFGVVLQRSRFCFYCITRDFFSQRDAGGLLGLLAALAVGLLGYYVLFSVFVPVPSPGRLPPGAHIGPLSWVLVAGAATFGIGMALSGSCISAHLYRLGEGSLASPFALLGAMVGFGLGFASWNTLYLSTIQEAPVVWLPHWFGYGGSLLLQLLVLGLIAFGLARAQRKRRQDGEAADAAPAAVSPRAPQASVWQAVFQERWPTYVGGLLVAAIGVMAFLRSAPLGVTAEIGSIARTTASYFSLLPQRLEGLDGFAGCATAVKDTLLSRNGLFVLSLVAGSLASALVAGDFKPRRPSLAEIARNFTGGVLMGWGGMLALGCTVGTLLSGIMAGAASGWVFAAACLAGAWLGWRVRTRYSF